MIEAVAIERTALGGFRVCALPAPGRALRKTFLKRGNSGFSLAAGYASRMAANMGCAMIDRTGRLSEADCAALVAAWFGEVAA